MLVSFTDPYEVHEEPFLLVCPDDNPFVDQFFLYSYLVSSKVFLLAHFIFDIHLNLFFFAFHDQFCKVYPLFWYLFSHPSFQQFN